VGAIPTIRIIQTMKELPVENKDIKRVGGKQWGKE
jgi:hypothetical protein